VSGAVDKCTFCVQRIYDGRPPACVETCPTKVRIFGDVNDPNSEVSRLLVANNYRVEKPEMGTDPNLFYVI
ncbi:MAG TPA: 4Fe-4S dicluster domain-containing protein, partial [Desulfopila sp.]|nr:4Fe-4S dicluster domain-containing protein [Desulfopila sp.]